MWKDIAVIMREKIYQEDAAADIDVFDMQVTILQ